MDRDGFVWMDEQVATPRPRQPLATSADVSVLSVLRARIADLEGQIAHLEDERARAALAAQGTVTLHLPRLAIVLRIGRMVARALRARAAVL